MKVTATIDDRELRARLASIKTQSPAAYKAAAEAGGKTIRDELEREAPKHTGKAAKDIAVEATAAGSGATAEIGPRRRWYLRLHEKGTAKMAAHPFVEPSIETVGDDAAEDAGKAYLKKVGL